MLDLTPFLSSCSISIVLFILSLFWYCLRGCNFAFLKDLRFCTSKHRNGGLRTGFKWSSGFDYHFYGIFISGEETFNKIMPRGGALHSLWDCRASQLCIGLYLLKFSQNFHAKLKFMFFLRNGLLSLRMHIYIYISFQFQNIVRVGLLHFNLKCSRLTPLAPKFTSGLIYDLPQNLLEKVLYIHLIIRFSILIFYMIFPQKCFNFFGFLKKK